MGLMNWRSAATFVCLFLAAGFASAQSHEVKAGVKLAGHRAYPEFPVAVTFNHDIAERVFHLLEERHIKSKSMQFMTRPASPIELYTESGRSARRARAYLATLKGKQWENLGVYEYGFDRDGKPAFVAKVAGTTSWVGR